MVKNVNELFKGKVKIKKGNLPHKFPVGSSVKFGKKNHTVKYPTK